MDLENIDKHFADILKLNDDILKTKYLFVQFGHVPQNLDIKFVCEYLRKILKKSSVLERIIIEDMYLENEMMEIWKDERE